MRILSIDYGKKRTGIAVTDPLQLIANGLTTVDTKELLKFLQEYVSREPVERIVIGLPVQPNGQPSENQARVRSFTGTLAKALPEIPIEFYDERFTSVLASTCDTRQRHRKNETSRQGISRRKSLPPLFYKNYMEQRRNGF